MVVDANVLSESFGKSEIYPLWNQSMMTQPDEIRSARHQMMFFPEFVEAICRVAERLVLPSIDENQNLTEFFDSKPNHSFYLQRPLKKKIESFLWVLSNQILRSAAHTKLITAKMETYKKLEMTANKIAINPNAWRDVAEL